MSSRQRFYEETIQKLVEGLKSYWSAHSTMRKGLASTYLEYNYVQGTKHVTISIQAAGLYASLPRIEEFLRAPQHSVVHIEVFRYEEGKYGGETTIYH